MTQRKQVRRLPPLRMAKMDPSRNRLRLRRQPARRHIHSHDDSDVSMLDAEAISFDDGGGSGDGDTQQDIATMIEEDMQQLDLAAADAGIPEIDRTLLPSGFDDSEFRAAAEYDNLIFDEGGGEDDEDDDEGDAELMAERQQTPFLTTMPAPKMPGESLHLSDFELALGLMAHVTGTSNRDWSILREVFCLPLNPDDARPLRAMSSLPKALATLKNQVTKIMPLLDMRMVDVPLKAEKLPTIAPADKTAAEPADGPTAKMHFFDPTDLFKTVLSSQLKHSLHLDMAHFVDRPSELYHSRAWASSLRTSSGNYAHFINSDGGAGDAIFLSDWVYFSCDDPDCQCVSYDSRDLDAPEPTLEEIKTISHIGRVVAFSKTFQTYRHLLVDPGDIVLEIEEACRRTDGRFLNEPCLQGLANEIADDELVLFADSHWQLSEASIIDFCRITLDRQSGDDLTDPSFYFSDKKRSGKKPMPYAKYPARTPVTRREDHEWILRRVVLPTAELGWFYQLPAIRAEKELEVYGRSWFIDHWDRLAPGSADRPDPISLPCTTFIDGFGLFRNSHRTLVGMYMTLAGLNVHERRRRANTFPVLLSPHGSIFEEAIDALRCFIPLDKGILIDSDDGTQTLMCAFTLCYIGDMLQQNQNAGCLGPTARKPCRFYYIGKKTLIEAFKDTNPGATLLPPALAFPHLATCDRVRPRTRILTMNYNISGASSVEIHNYGGGGGGGDPKMSARKRKRLLRRAQYLMRLAERNDNPPPAGNNDNPPPAGNNETPPSSGSKKNPPPPPGWQ
ncbi:hypothetical protein ACJ41O_006136 [Fusarium nematophilum]